MQLFISQTRIADFFSVIGRIGGCIDAMEIQCLPVKTKIKQEKADINMDFNQHLWPKFKLKTEQQIDTMLQGKLKKNPNYAFGMFEILFTLCVFFCKDIAAKIIQIITFFLKTPQKKP